ncbi:hypothetical protein CABS01_00988 [Colletotrichum abscissum]|uniref:Uncharacterized protein n=1 Tax=Colletotrichum abscissum TaxID=1671311 RepID=A0A9P9XIQ1_9PEZI|nr:uncharacterized protein CABS01_00988 [Colletotrichum abscissum]KAI3554301.1 hypothetical protein CABS02_05432 [Colletotrichum abscissum]KAK1505520.1 hypothetical protein CABS01_00988 [Colletotrichum abscissum]
MAYQPTRDGKEGSMVLSMDIILLIVDHLIADAKEADKGIVWWLAYVHETPSKVVFLEDFVENGREKVNLRGRFRRLQLPSQINRMSRSLVHREFLRHPMGKIYRTYVSERLPIDAWVLPAIDRFIPLVADKDEANMQLAALSLRQSLHLPTPQAPPLIDCIRRIHLPLRHEFGAALTVLAALPSLTELAIVVGQWHDIHTKTTPDPSHKKALRRINHAAFPELAEWEEEHADDLQTLWLPFQKRGVRFFGKMIERSGYVMELTLKKNRLYMRLCHPFKRPQVCSHCKAIRP